MHAMSENTPNSDDFRMPVETSSGTGILNNMELAQKNPSLWLWIGIIIAIVAVFGYFVNSQEERISDLKTDRDSWKEKHSEVTKLYNDLLTSKYYGTPSIKPINTPNDTIK